MFTEHTVKPKFSMMDVVYIGKTPGLVEFVRIVNGVPLYTVHHMGEGITRVYHEEALSDKRSSND